MIGPGVGPLPAISVLGALAISAFSSVINERFDPLHAKTVVTNAGTGGALGGVLGGVVALFLSEALTIGALLYGLGGISVVVALGIWQIGGSTQPERSTDGEPVRSGARLLFEDAYLRNVALTVVLLGGALQLEGRDVTLVRRPF